MTQIHQMTTPLRFAIRFVPVSLALAVTAPLAAQALTIRDSTGIRIVENPARLTAPVAFRLGDKPTYSVGGLEGNPDIELRPSNGYLRATRLASGSVAVADEIRVQFFDAAGKRTAIAGRQGSGPQEFRGIIGICATRGDTVVAGDGRNSRSSILAPSGTIVGTAPDGELGIPGFDGCLDDGTFIRVYHVPSARGTDRIVRVTPLRLDGSVANLVGEFSIGPFDAYLDREPTVAASGQSVYVADARTHEVRVYRASGGLATIIRTRDRLNPITQADAEAVLLTRIVTDFGTALSQAQKDSRLANMRGHAVPTAWPAYRRIAIDRSGRIWIEDYQQVIGESTGWTAFDANGRLIGRLRIPRTAAGVRSRQVLAFGTTDVLFVEYDADGAAYIRAYPLIPGSAQ